MEYAIEARRQLTGLDPVADIDRQLADASAGFDTVEDRLASLEVIRDDIAALSSARAALGEAIRTQANAQAALDDLPGKRFRLCARHQGSRMARRQRTGLEAVRPQRATLAFDLDVLLQRSRGQLVSNLDHGSLQKIKNRRQYDWTPVSDDDHRG